MKLTATISTKIDQRFADVKPQSLYAKLTALVTCDLFSPRLNNTQAHSLLAQRTQPKRRPSISRYSHNESAFQAAKAARPDLY
jgi:hypothetical protein